MVFQAQMLGWKESVIVERQEVDAWMADILHRVTNLKEWLSLEKAKAAQLDDSKFLEESFYGLASHLEFEEKM